MQLTSNKSCGVPVNRNKEERKETAIKTPRLSEDVAIDRFDRTPSVQPINSQATFTWKHLLEYVTCHIICINVLAASISYTGTATVIKISATIAENYKPGGSGHRDRGAYSTPHCPTVPLHLPSVSHTPLPYSIPSYGTPPSHRAHILILYPTPFYRTPHPPTPSSYCRPTIHSYSFINSWHTQLNRCG